MAAHPFPAWIRLLQGAAAGAALLAGASLAASPLPPMQPGSTPIAVVPFAGRASVPGPWTSTFAPWPACRGCDLRGVDLRGRHLIGLDLRGADLSGADLRGANLEGADLSGARLVGARLENATLTNADLANVDLSGADLRGAVAIQFGLPRPALM